MQLIIQENRFQPDELLPLIRAAATNQIAVLLLNDRMMQEAVGNLEWTEGSTDDYLFALLTVDNFLLFYENALNMGCGSSPWYNPRFFNRAWLTTLCNDNGVAVLNQNYEVGQAHDILRFVNQNKLVFTNQPTKSSFTSGTPPSTAMLKHVLLPAGDLWNSQFFIADAQNVVDESRFFIINDEVVTSSPYRRNGNFVVTAESNFVGTIEMADAKKVVKQLALLRSQNPEILKHYVLDMARVEGEKNFRLLEVNAVPTSGFYEKHDLTELLGAIKKAVEQ
jgi:hypothetical protein